MNIDYLVYDPGGNITVLVLTPVEKDLYPAAAQKIMEREPSSEQVGFLVPQGLRMAGGEFCGNATLSAAAYFLGDTLEIGEKKEISLDVSGAGTVTVTLTKDGENAFSGEVEMPLPLREGIKELPADGGFVSLPVVEFPGISHVIYEGKPDPAAEKYIAAWCKVLNADALGIMFLENGNLTPLVYVPSAGTTVWESSCASGTTAVGVYLKPDGMITFREPGGVLGVSYRDGKPLLFGKTELIEKKSADI